MKDSEINEYLADLKELTDIESPTSSIDGVNEVAAWFKKRAEILGLKSRSIDLGTDKVAPCLFISNDLDVTNYDFLFIGHMDTVFPVDTKAEVPFKKIDERINALGVIDDKGGSLLSLYVIKELDFSRLKIGLFLNSHEEIGSNFAKDAIKEFAKKSRYALVVEPAREDGSMVATRKGVISYVLNFRGVSAHAGNHPERGRSAVVEAANFIVELSKLTDFKAGHTFNSIMTKGGDAQNVVPDFASVTFEMRYRHASSVEFLHKKMDEILSHPLIPEVICERILINEEGPMIDEANLPNIKKVFDEAAEAIGTKVAWVDAGGLSDGNISASAGCPTIDGLGPTGGNMHTKNEYLEINSVVKKCNLIVEAIKRLS